MNDPHQRPDTIDSAHGAAEEVEIDLVKVLARAVRGYRTILAFTLGALVLSVAISLSLGKTYTAQAVFLPPVAPDALQATSLLLRQSPSDVYLGMLASRSVEDSVIDQTHLMSVYRVRLRSRMRDILAKLSVFSVEKNALVTITVTTKDPKLSADIGNAYLEALYKLNGAMSASSSSHRSEFFEEQLDQERNSLAEAEYNMQQMQEKTGMVLPQEEAQAGLTATARLQASIGEAQARLSSLLTGSTEQNPQVIQQRAQIDALREELRQQQISETSRPGTGLPSTAKLPALMLDYVRKSRELKERETLFETLTVQYEKARLASLDPGPQLEIVDPAIVPDHKSGPPRTLIVLGATFFGFVLGLLTVLLAGPFARLKRRYREVSARM
jgi:tyrosine-protein kinase Etk/Wzc